MLGMKAIEDMFPKNSSFSNDDVGARFDALRLQIISFAMFLDGTINDGPSKDMVLNRLLALYNGAKWATFETIDGMSEYIKSSMTRGELPRMRVVNLPDGNALAD